MDSRAAKIQARIQHEREVIMDGGAPVGLDSVGYPTWSRSAWEQFKAKFGRYPTIRDGDLPNMQEAPDWAYELQGLRPPPVSVTTGSAGAGPIPQSSKWTET